MKKQKNPRKPSKGFINTKFQEYFYALSEPRRKQFAKRADTTAPNIVVNYTRRIGKRHKDHFTCFRSTHVQPNSRVMLLLARATKGECTYDDMLDHFYRK